MQDEFEEAVRRLESGDASKFEVLSSAKVITKYAKTYGLSSKKIYRVTKICTDDSVKSLSARKMLSNALIPVDCIPEEAGVCVLLKVCSGKCSGGVGKILLKWLVSKFESIRSTSDLQSLAGLLLYFSESEQLSQPISQLVKLIMCDQHGNPYSVRVEGLKRFGAFHQARKRKLIVKNPKIFSNEFLSMLRKYSPCLEKIGLEDLNYQDEHTVGLSPLCVTVPHLQILLHHQLSTVFVENLGKTEDFDNAMKPFFLLNDILQHTNQVWLSFITDYLATWNLTDRCETLLRFLSVLPVAQFPDLQQRILNSLRKAILFSHDVALKCEIIDTLQDLVLKYIISAAHCENYDEIRICKFAVVKIMNFVEDVVLESVLIDSDGNILTHALVDFWETTSMTLQKFKVNVGYTPHPYFMSKSLFGFSSSNLASLCRTLSALCQNPSGGNKEIFGTLQEQGSRVCDILCQIYQSDEDFSRIQNWKNDYLGLEDVLSSKEEMDMFAFNKHPAFSVSLFKIRAKNQGDFYLQEFLDSIENDGLKGVSDLVRNFVDIP